MKIGIVGAGGMGNIHARHLSGMPDVELLVCDLDAQKLEQFRARHSAMATNSSEELIAQADIVDLCVPTDVHFELALKSLAARKPTFIEKPVARTVAEGKRIAEAAQKAGVPVGIGQVVRYFPEYKTAREMVRAGKVGKPAAARVRRGGGLPGKGSAWFADHHRSGGVLIDLAIHDFDWLRWTLGEVKELYSRSVGASTMSGPDYALTTMTFEGGAIAHVESTWMDPSGFRTSFEISGSEGLIEYDSRQTAIVKTLKSDSTVSESPLSSEDDPYYQQLKGFVEAVSNGTEPPVTLNDGLLALAITEAAMKSAQTGEVVAPVV